jgi:hypothetical protein
MEPSTEPNDLRRDQFQEFAMQHLQARAEVSEVSNQVPSKFYLL